MLFERGRRYCGRAVLRKAGLGGGEKKMPQRLWCPIAPRRYLKAFKALQRRRFGCYETVRVRLKVVRRCGLAEVRRTLVRGVEG